MVADYDLAHIAVCHDAFSLLEIPVDVVDDALTILALEADPRLLKHVGRQYLTKELCPTALAEFPELLPHVPREWVSEEHVLCAIQDYPEVFEELDGELNSESACGQAVELMGANLQYVSSEWEAGAGEDVYLRLVAIEPHALEFIN
jgi:hypothetical protein